MDEMKYVKLVEINGRPEAEILESYLEAEGIDAELFQESIGHTSFAMTVDGLGRVQVFVPKDKIQEARELLKIFQTGNQEE